MKRFLPLVLLVCTLHSSAKGQSTQFDPSFTAITVKNIDSSILWYSSVLNLRMRNRVDNAERGFKQAVLINDGIMIELVELVKGISPDSVLALYPQGSRLQGVTKFGFTVPDIEKLFQQLSLSGIKLFGKMVTDPVNQKKTFLVQDPDNNLVQFFER
jgi:catechol 2,3-dioxygenase-like lactoylglutathione lyase family enzyme